jgi:hypothetical protein
MESRSIGGTARRFARRKQPADRRLTDKKDRQNRNAQEKDTFFLKKIGISYAKNNI